jgi:hypothetical protein
MRTKQCLTSSDVKKILAACQGTARLEITSYEAP